MKFTGLLDMLDGGGAGATGNEFKGGPLSGLLNAIGIRPMGYRDRMEGMANTRPQMRPQMPQRTSTQGPLRPQARPQQMPQQLPNYGPPGMVTPGGPPGTGARQAAGLSFEEFVAGLGPVAQSATRDQLMQAYMQHMQQYQR